MRTILRDDHTQRAIDEVPATIEAAFSEAEFTGHHGVDPGGIDIEAYTKAEDNFAVLDRVSDRLGDLWVEEGLGIYVVPLAQEKPDPMPSSQRSREEARKSRGAFARSSSTARSRPAASGPC